ncbi:hypothetical protein lerEdw1_001969 [Lerista edwardsae]|nr:hypothetical protein lerEdw1_001969 [Lerista edwardsae]
MWLTPVLLMCLLSGYMSVQGSILGKMVDPEASMTVEQLIEYWGYPCERHEVVTEDGYVLVLFRIPHGRGNSPSTGPKEVAFLQHGLLVDAANWIQNPPDNSLGFILADAGYDVWLANSRGNTWGRKHLSLPVSEDKFWKFSFDEMAKYDLPAAIDFVLQKTGQQQIYYIGHSQGTTIAFIAFSTNPQLAAKIKIFFCFAPVVTVKYAKTPLRSISLLPDFSIKVLFGEREFLPDTYFGDLVASEFCSINVGSLICSNLLFILCGFNWKNLNMEASKSNCFIFQSRVDMYASHAPAGTSVINMIHWKQAISSGKFQAYDYGLAENLVHYKQALPLQYNISAMTVPTAMWTGGNDWLSGPLDVEQFLPKMGSLIFYKHIEDWNHLDFVFGSDAPEVMYDKILNILQENPIL